MISGSGRYERAKKILFERFGNKFLVTANVIQDLKSGQSAHLPKYMLQLADDLAAAYGVLSCLGTLGEMDTPSILVEVLRRCHPQVRTRWRTKSLKQMDAFGKYPNFINKEALHASDPVYGFSDGKNVKRGVACNYSVKQIGTRPKEFGRCIACCQYTHPIVSCHKFKATSPKQRLYLAWDSSLCFNCLEPGHVVPHL